MLPQLNLYEFDLIRLPQFRVFNKNQTYINYFPQNKLIFYLIYKKINDISLYFNYIFYFSQLILDSWIVANYLQTKGSYIIKKISIIYINKTNL